MKQRPTIIKPDGNPALSPAQKECIQLLKQVLESAEKGDVMSVAVIACGAADFGAAIAGPDAPRLSLGLDVAKQEILRRVAGAGPRTVLHRG